MAVGAFLEPLVVVTLLFGGAWEAKRSGWAGRSLKRSDDVDKRLAYHESLLSGSWSGSSTPTLAPRETPTLRRRKLQFLGYSRLVTTPNTLVFKDRLLSRVLQKVPFLAEAWYWALIYWVYQLGRAFTAVSLVDGTVDVAREHALQLVHLEQRLGVFYEVPFQQWFLARPLLMHWANRVYSFIHIPGTIFFLVALYYLTTTRRRRTGADKAAAGPALYEARRRTMAMCNLLAFVVFTLWPCMPPRLLSDAAYRGDHAPEAKSYGFVDTAATALRLRQRRQPARHGGRSGSTHRTGCRTCCSSTRCSRRRRRGPFGYSLLVGLTLATLPVARLRPASWKRAAMVAAAMSYPALILTVVVATANHFILDAVAGALVCAVAWHANGLLLSLYVIEDYFLWLVHIHKPVNCAEPETAVESELEIGLLGEDAL